jgi:hypothetical protein
MTSNNDILNTSSVFQYFLMGEIVMFSICLIMLQIKTRTVYIFLLANMLAVIANILILNYLHYKNYYIIIALGESLLLLY